MEGNIITQALASNPIFLEGHDFDLSSGEITNFFANSDIPFVTNTAGFLADYNTGIWAPVPIYLMNCSPGQSE